MAKSILPIRILTAVPICDGHDSPITSINVELVRSGIEVIYLGYHRSAEVIARAAIQEDVDAIGISSYNGGHVEFFAEVIERLKGYGGEDIRVFGGGGGTITEADAQAMAAFGVDRIFFAGTPLSEITDYATATYGNARQQRPTLEQANHYSDRYIAQRLTTALSQETVSEDPSSHSTVIGFTGPGGVGKTTLIDELVLRFLKTSPEARVAVLLHDPSLSSHGALLGDRACMVYAHDERVFMRSLACGAHSRGLSKTTAACIKAIRNANGNGPHFDLILIETLGIGQEAMPFPNGLVDRTVMVMGPDYGSQLQLHKIAMLDLADIVVVNKSDLALAKTASAEIAQRLTLNTRDQQLITTVAKRHGDAGVDTLFQEIIE